MGSAGRRPPLKEFLRAYLEDCSRLYTQATVYRYGVMLDVFLSWLAELGGPPPTVGLLSKGLLQEHYDWLRQTGRHDRPRSEETCRKHIGVIQAAWAWGANEDEWAELLPPPRRLRLKRPARNQVVAPTWAEMDAAIRECPPVHRYLAVVLRFTGLRVGQVMGLRWDDLDLERGELNIRGELGKSAGERAGRVIPISPHLVEILGSWERASEWLVPSNRKEGPRERKARSREMGAAWARAGVREEVWRQRPHHCFRKGFTTELKLAGADTEGVEYLVGHSAGIRDHYVDPRAHNLVEAVGLIPPFSASGLTE